MNKDIQQAEELLEVLLEDRPGDVWIALEATQGMPDKFQQQLAGGLRFLSASVKQALHEHSLSNG